MKKLLKWLGIILMVIIAGIFILFLVFNESKPESVKGAEAEALAEKMLVAIDKKGWDTTGVVQWNFGGRQKYVWDKQRNLAKVEWGDHMVLLNPDQVDGKAYQNGQELTDEKANKAVQTAWSHWCNDSFWLNAPAKCMDPGTSRGIVKLENGAKALMVTYDSGGVTPGDSYLWILDENGLPRAWKMWVKIIPMGGIGSSWENYETLYSGAKISGMHKMKAFDLIISDIKAGKTFQDIGIEDPFVALTN